jgi:hypothetical protein
MWPKNLPGTWHTALAAENESTFTIAPNGDFTCRTVSPAPTTNPPIELAGTLQVKDGFLIETVTNSTQPRIQGRIPFVSRAQIIRTDAHEMVITFDGTNRFVLQKQTP